MILSAIKNKDITTRINVSFHKTEIPTPLSITPLRMMMNHFAGITLLIYCSGNGILDKGKINPESRITGSISPISDIISAACWVFARVDINTPRAKEVMINKMLSTPKRNKLP